MSIPCLSGRQLACRRGGRQLFRGLDLQVRSGEIVWVRGPNGSGKTSLLRMAAGLLPPERGQLLWDNQPLIRASNFARQRLYIGHANALKEELSVRESLGFLLRLRNRDTGIDTIDAALAGVGLGAHADVPVARLSQGQRRRVALARLVAEREASLWILDEPFDSLDADGMLRLNALMNEHRRRGGSVLLSGHHGVDAALLQPARIELQPHA
jgi:heme exporter protein A